MKNGSLLQVGRWSERANIEFREQLDWNNGCASSQYVPTEKTGQFFLEFTILEFFEQCTTIWTICLFAFDQ
jgi:hypothetical protein